VNVPARLETARLVLRAWSVADAPALTDALEANADHLRGQIPTTVAEPAPLEAITARIEGYERSFATGAEWLFAIIARDDGRLIGGIGLYPRIGPGALELGYWAQARETGQGYVTEAAAALTAAAFELPEIERVEIRCDPANVASAAVARRLGYVHAATIPAKASSRRTTGETMVWVLSRETFQSERATSPSFHP
jgi:RimJ/RimL family protein N-acetyltransferase